MNKKIIFIIAIIYIFLLPIAAQANVVYLECYKKGNCGICDVLELMSKIAKFILTLSASLALLFFVIGGLMWIISQGNPEKIQAGKKIFLGSILGLGIVYFAWVGVNFILYNFSGSQQNGENIARIFNRPWNEIKCIKTPDEYTQQQEPEQVLPTSPPKSCGADIGISCNGSCVNFATSGINPSQCSDASLDLVNLLKCIDYQLNVNSTRYGSFKKSDIVITSISDDNGLARCRDNYIQPPCFHKNNSCHYGGGTKKDGSYAVDIRSRGIDVNKQIWLNMLVNECNANFIDETYVTTAPHFHISAGECSGR
ncbi:pilin [Candidatus Parcubacteria bacterium]|nr:pilin [Patescibacteria group bacterium]MBU4481829.1 pilin [Patescibacteria group bacterium]MCG2686907.1 pilin [Candidatus Parcubacteria bacterium]